MKNYVRIVIVVCIIFVIGLLGCLTIMDRHLHNISENDVDVIQLNDIRETVKQNWDALQNLDSEEFEVDFVVLDNINNILYSSDSIEENEKLTVEEAIKNRYPYSYVVRDNKIVGCVVMLDSGEEIYMSIRNKMILGFGICGLTILLGAVLFALYIQKNSIVPFKQMEDFTGKVAEGKLDEPLLTEKNNMFGVFY